MTSAEISNLDAALLYVVVDPKLSSRVIEAGKEMGIGGASVMRGRGTVRSGLLNALGIVDSRKEIVLMAGDMPTVRRVLDGLTQQFGFDQPNKGIAFAVRLTGVAGTDACASWTRREDRPVADAPGWKLIVTIVDEDVEEDVLESAQKAGMRGGTIVHAHGAGSAQTSKVFDMEIEPEKSLVFMLVPAAEASRVSQFIYRDLGLDRPNSGILYIHDLLQVRGLYRAHTSSSPETETSALDPETQTTNLDPETEVPALDPDTETTPTHRSLLVIVEKGAAKRVIAAAEAVGAPGGTIIQGRGLGVHDTARLFGRAVEPEKEMVLIIAPKAQVDALISEVFQQLEMDQPGNGVILLQDVSHALGLVKTR